MNPMCNPPETGPIILFDEVCLLCNRFVQFVLHNEKGVYFRFTSLQSQTGRTLLGRSEYDQDILDSFYVIDGSDVHARSDAALFVIRRLSWPWRIAAILAIIPRSIRDLLYRLVAANRYAIFGKTTVCALPTERTVGRIIE